MSGKAEEISLYFHIPFCSRKCDYCHFFVLPDQEINKDRLLRGFEQEWERWRPAIQNKTIISIYFGGGTPSLFGPARLSQILERIYRQATVAPDCETTLEANPDQLNRQKLEDYRSTGVNRLSIGLQSLHDGLLRSLGREHDAAQAVRAVEEAAAAGYRHLSVDLMYDLPDQTLEIWESTLRGAASLPITHLSLYNLTIEPHTVFHKKRNLIVPQLPDPETSLAMYEKAEKILSENGLIPYEISAFGRNGDLSRHNLGYWTGRPFLGFGPSAFSYWEGRRFRNVANLNKYCRSLDKAEFAIDFEERLDPEARRRELLAIGIRLRAGLDLTVFEGRYGALSTQTRRAIENLIEQGWVVQQGSSLFLTKQGILFYDSVATELI